MRRSVRLVMWAAVCMVMLAMASPPASAQGGGTSTSLSGLVVDTSGGVMPGADVVVKNNATGAVSQTATDTGGRFTIPALEPGTYTVTISLTGFKTVVLPDVPIVTGTPASLKAILEIGKIEESVVVTGASELVQTQSAAVQTTLVVQQIQQLPLTTRTALDYVVNMPGVSTSGSNSRGSSISGLPRESINITLDGVNVQDNRNKGDGFFMFIRPLLDSVEEITVSTANPGAESSGQGATQIRMMTRSGTNRFSGAVYNTWRNQAGVSEDDVMSRSKPRKWIWKLNTPYWFNKRDQPKTAAGDYFIDDIRLQTPGFRVGGPVMKDKLFYFFNLEYFLWPNQANRIRYMMNTTAMTGLFTYSRADNKQLQALDLLALAASNGQTSTIDPSIGKLLADIRSAAGTMGGVQSYDENVDKYTFSPAGDQKRYFPTARLDYNLTAAHRLSGTFRYNHFASTPDILNGYENRFPGFPNQGGQFSNRYMWQVTMRSTIGKSMVNEGRVGYQGATKEGVYFRPEVNEGQFNCSGLGCQSVGGKGYALSISAFEGITNPTFSTSATADVAPLFSFEDALTWLKGRHSISAGFSYTRVKWHGWTNYAVPTISFGLNAADPAYGMLQQNSGNFPGGISSTYAGYAQNLYAVLTGRVTGYSGSAYLSDDGSYHFLGELRGQSQGSDIGMFISDSWRLKPNLTLTAGLRYEVQLPFITNGNYSRPESWQMVYGITGAGSGRFGQGNLFQPGLMTGTNPLVVPFPKDTGAYNTDWNNFAPSVGVAWRPSLKPSLLTKILSTDPVVRGGYSITYTRLGANFFDDNYSPNPGRSRTASRTTTTGDPVIGYDGFPVLLRDSARLFPGAYPSSVSYPITPAVNESIDTHYPNWPTSYTHQYSVGFQRDLGKTMAIDIRYVGNTNVGAWYTANMTSTAQWNVLENGWYKEFQTAEKNLQANLAAGYTGSSTTFAYTGAPGTAPLPIFLAHFAGIPLNDPRNQVPANYITSASSSACTASTPNFLACFKNSGWYNSLAMYAPSLTGMAGTGTSGLQNAKFETNALLAGLPRNFWQANPALKQGSSMLEVSGGNTSYNSIQIELRRRMSEGLLVSGSYVAVLSRKTWTWRSLREDWISIDSTGGPVHAVKFNWVYELPFGRGKPFGGGVSRGLDYLIGGWEFDGVARIQSGDRFNFGGYQLVGMTEQDLQKMFKIRMATDSAGKTRVYMLPDDVIRNSIIALNQASPTSLTGYSGALPTGRYLAPASGPDCVQYLSGMCPGTKLTRIITGPWYYKFDFSFVKRIAVYKNMRVEARMDLYNILDTINFAAVGVGGSSMSSWEVSSAARDLNASQDAGGRITSFGLRFTW